MAEKEEKEEPKEEPKEEKEEPKKEESTKTVEKIVERDREPSLVDCPECDLSVREDKLGSHRWKAHQVERRADREKSNGEPDDTIAPPKKKHATTNEKREEKKQEATGLFGAWRR